MGRFSTKKEKEYLRILMTYNQVCDSFGELSMYVSETYKKERTCQVANCTISTLYRALNMGKKLLVDYMKII
jgi:hypothetical protein